jgi:serine/threonine protein kinase
VHRDVKPSNILLAHNDFAYLIDFGIARSTSDTALTSANTTIGTWAYMAPERFNTGQSAPSSDIYALACVLYQCLTGELPFPADTLEQVAVSHMVMPPPRPSQERDSIPTAMDHVIATGLAKQPADRYPSTRTFTNGLPNLQADYTVTTDCLRTGDRCMSYFHEPSDFRPLVFSSGNWTLDTQSEGDCPDGSVFNLKATGQYPLPQPPQNPIPTLTGRGQWEQSDPCAVSVGFDETFTRTGD